ncbi:MAG: hypothetical protein QG610_1967 [Euryarchaeota archaeon]|nr:hypothetical protein [Euryarchaeota archaeon]
MEKDSISDLCTFWSLHVAIQDAMGWLDYHLHEFTLKSPNSKEDIRMGIPFEDDIEEMNPEAGWMFKVSPFLESNKNFLYVYDFGDNWRHTIEFEGIYDKTPGNKYPCCIDGARKCPPEDVGSIHGYEMLIKAMKNKRHPQFKEYLAWLGERYDPNDFNSGKVKFSNPNDRLNLLLED